MTWKTRFQTVEDQAGVITDIYLELLAPVIKVRLIFGSYAIS